MQSEGKNVCDQRIVVNLANQDLRLFEHGEECARYPVSTSKFGPGCEEGSYRTPLGHFTVDTMIGAGSPERTIFRSRLPDGMWEPGKLVPEDEGDLVLTRILWLHGVEEQNANTKQRYIYIHGTNHEELIGSPESQGCVRMKNADMVDLFGRVAEGTAVEIV